MVLFRISFPVRFGILVRLISDEDLRKTMGQKSRERAVNLFSWDKAVDSYLNIMESVIR